jgi:putative transposase
MRGPQPPTITLSDAERQTLEQLVRGHRTSQQLALRARVILAAAEGANNSQIARQEGVHIDTVRLWRVRWLGLQAVALDDLSVEDRLTDAPRPGKPVRITAEQVCQIVALACEAPAHAGRPISQWTAREIAEEITQRQIVPQISPHHAARLLKRGRCSPIVGGIG